MAVRGSIIASVLLMATAASPALAANAVRGAHDAMMSGDFAAAERMLTSERRVFPDHAEVLLNLAAVYANTGRPELATRLYTRVLDRADVLMDLSADRVASSHAIARAGLRRLAPIETAAR